MFGDYVHIYDIEQAVSDGATVPVYYESRLVKLDLKPGETSHIDELAEELSEDEEEATTSARYRKWAALEKIVAASRGWPRWLRTWSYTSKSDRRPRPARPWWWP